MSTICVPARLKSLSRDGGTFDLGLSSLVPEMQRSATNVNLLWILQPTLKTMKMASLRVLFVY